MIGSVSDNHGDSARNDIHETNNEFLRVFALETLLAPDSPLLEATGSIYSRIVGKTPEQAAMRTGNIYHLFSSVMECKRDQLALATESGHGELTYGALHEKINIIASELIKAVPTSCVELVRPRVLCLMAPSTDFFAATIATVKVGCCMVILDPTMESAKMKHCLQISGISVVITNLSSAKWTAAKLLFPSLAKIQSVIHIDKMENSSSSSDSFVETVEVDGTAELAITFTTGSTGLPKPIIKTHNFIKAQLYTLAEIHLYRRVIPGRPKPSSHPISGSVCFTNLPTFILGYLMYGCTVILPSTFKLEKMNPASLLAALDRFSTSLWAIAASPAFALKLATYAISQRRTIQARHCCVGGAPVFKHELETLIEAISGTVWVVYGSSEAEPMAMISAEDRLIFEGASAAAAASSDAVAENVKFALCGGYTDWVASSTIKIASLRDENSSAHFFSAPGKVGEIVVSGPHVHTIYYDRIITEAATGKQWLRTGDAGFVDALGRLWLLGRVDWAYSDPSKRPVPSAVRGNGTGDKLLYHYWSTSVERVLLDRFGETITYAVYLKHEGRAKLFIEAPNGCSAEQRTDMLNLLADFRAPVHELHVHRKIPRDKRHGSKPNTFMIFRALQRLRNRKPDHVIVGVKGQSKQSTGLNAIGESLRKGTAIVPESQFDFLHGDAHTAAANLAQDAEASEGQNVDVHFGDYDEDPTSWINTQQASVVWTPYDDKLPMILFSNAPEKLLKRFGGGKASNLARLNILISDIAKTCAKPSKASVPEFFCIATGALQSFIIHNGLQSEINPPPEITNPPPGANQQDREAALIAYHARLTLKFTACPFPAELSRSIYDALIANGMHHCYLAVRSSSAEEDASNHSFAGQFESKLYVPSWDPVAVERAVRECWLSGFAPRVMLHRLDLGISITTGSGGGGAGMSVVVQRMVDSVTAGVAFSRHPLKPLSADTVLVEAVWGQGEALVSGLAEADAFEVRREAAGVDAGKVVFKSVAEKSFMLMRDAENGNGVVQVEVNEVLKNVACLTDDKCAEIAHVAEGLERELGGPMDIEWAYCPNGEGLRCVQVRPIVTLPKNSFFSPDDAPQGRRPILWDNSNIIESYSGVTTPLTFSFASNCYGHVYRITLRSVHVPESVIAAVDDNLTNMLGLIRGNVYYNLNNWYKLLSVIPLEQFGDPKHMETMMGVKQGASQLTGDIKEEFDKILKERPKYRKTTSMAIQLQSLGHFRRIDAIVLEFFSRFNPIYEKARKTDFFGMSLDAQIAYVRYLEKEIMMRWDAPLINDLLVMSLFGTLKKLTAKLVIKPNASSGTSEAEVSSLQNDLLCGQGDVESAEPTKMLMKIAQEIDSAEDLRVWYASNTDALTTALKKVAALRFQSNAGAAVAYEARRLAEAAGAFAVRPEEVQRVMSRFLHFLDRFAFRCVNEQKFEEPDLYDNPSFVVEAVAGYIRTKSYSIEAMEQREKLIREKAEAVVRANLRGTKLALYMWVLKHTRKVVKHRENLRFARTKIYGVVRNIFRGIGRNLQKLGYIDDEQDVFYLTYQELQAFADGRSVTTDLRSIAITRRSEFDEYRKSIPPPERFITRGAAGAWLSHPQILADMDLLKTLNDVDEEIDPTGKTLKGVSCCPGVVEGTVRVVKDLTEAKGIDNEILVTARTDPGWVPLYPLCKGLVIERGSLLSHSAVVARELGLPTIVGVTGGLMKRLKTGMRVRVDATKGYITILDDGECIDDGDDGDKV